MKNRFPFRFGTTSYIVPADIIPNVEFLREMVDDIELVFFESDEFSNLPSKNDIQVLCELARHSSLTYSVHLPLDVYLGDPDRAERRKSVEKCLRIIERTEPLPKSAYVLHFEAGAGVAVNEFTVDEVSRFREALHDSSVMLLQKSALPAWWFCVENLDYPYEFVWPVVDAHGFSVTLDVGHIQHNGFSATEYIQHYFPRARVLHMHGVRGSRDHNDLAHMDRGILDMVMVALAADTKKERVFTMEIFSKDDFFVSCRTMQRYLPEG